MTRAVVALIIVAAAYAQPDFSNTDDFLKGRRTLLKVDDIAILGGVGRSSGSPYTAYYDMNVSTFKSQNSQVSTVPAGSWGDTGTIGPNIKTDLSAAFGRFWEGPTDTAAVAFHADASHFVLTLDRAGTAPGASPSFPFDPSIPSEPIGAFLIGDYNGDGYSDVAMTAQQQGNTYFVIAHASDTSKPSAPSFGPIAQLPLILAMTSADVNGDGQTEFVGVYGTGNGGIALGVWTLDPTTLAINQLTSLTLNVPNVSASTPITMASIAAGRFGLGSQQAVALTYADAGGVVFLKLISFSNLQPTEADTIGSTSGFQNGVTGTIGVKAGRLLASSSYDSLVFMFAARGNSSPENSGFKYMRIVDIDPATLKMSLHSFWYDYSPADCAFDWAIGNFDQQVPDPTNPGSTTESLDKQLAFVTGSCSGTSSLAVSILSLNTDFTIKNQTVPNLPAPTINANKYLLITGDIQGRSVVLGAPTKFELNSNIQTSIVAAAPPSHVDFISPDGISPPAVLAVSTLPESYKSTYTSSSTSKLTAGVTSGSSWGFAASESINQTLSLGDLDDDGTGLKEKATFTAAQSLKGEMDTQSGSYATTQLDLSTSSAMGDNFWYTSSRLNLWVYPVLGSKVCPKAKPNCQDSEKVQPSIVYSAPDQIQTASVTQGSSPVYQPPWEYGNVLSYPNNFSQLNLIFPNLKLLSETTPLSFSLWQGNLSINASWGGGSSTGQQASLAQNYSFDTNLSVQGAVGEPKVASIGGGFDLDVSNSFGTSSQTSYLTQVDTSTGMTITKPYQPLPSSSWDYLVTPYIFGQQKPPAVVDSSKTPSTTVNAFGALQSAFTADVLSSSLNIPFWKSAYGSLPDVGLSHPQRWQSKTAATPSSVPPNCIVSGSNNSQYECFDVFPHQPQTPLTSNSLFMQGFFVTQADPASASAKACAAGSGITYPTRNTNTDQYDPGPGPNLTTAIAGTPVTLKARVYNFSLAGMPNGSNVHVQFYGMSIDPQNKPISSFKIGPDVVQGPIPPVTNGNSLNWVYATTDFCTTGHAGETLVFWVVAWAETGSGSSRALVKEIAGHGLMGIPPDVLASMADVKVEMNLSADKSQSVSYSNNLGIFPMHFYVLAPSTTSTLVSRAAAPAAATGNSAKLLPMQVTQTRTPSQEQLIVGVPVQADNVPVMNAMVHFYDGHPDDGGKLIRVQHLAWVEPHQQRLAEISYFPRTPGYRRIWAFLNKGADKESVRASRVICVGKSCSIAAPASTATAFQSTQDPREKP